MTRTADIFGSSVVAVGAFNPAIFSPDWLERNKLIGKGDADGATKSSAIIISHQATVFETEWFALQVLENQFSLTSKGALTPAIKDLAVGIFSLVPHTPITALGLNFLAHFKFGAEAEYHKIGDVLAPKTIWDGLYPEGRSAGMQVLSIRIQDADRGSDLRTGNEKRISIQPSDKVRFGVLMLLNDHREIRGSADGIFPADQAASIVDSDWQSSCDDAIRVFDYVVSNALAARD